MKRLFVQSAAARAGLVLLLAAALTFAGLKALDLFDNKYRTKTPIAQDGAGLAPEFGVTFLADGWTLYPDRLLTPEDFAGGAQSPAYRTMIGEYANLAPFHADKNPYGVATYRIRLRGEGMKSLYLQEPLCAARIYVDGVLLGETGEVDPPRYRPRVKDMVCSFSLRGEAELVIQTANFSHYYGGLYYPPALGDPDSVSRLAALRAAFYGLLCFTPLALALFCAALWMGGRDPRDPVTFYFGALCLSFSLRVCYPFIRLAGLPAGRLFYALEDAAALTGLYCVVRIAQLLFLQAGRPQTAARALSLGMCGVCVLLPALVLPAFPSFTALYGRMISWYKLSAALYLIGAAVHGVLRARPHACPALAAVTAYGVCLLASVTTIGRFEPAVAGWPDEYGSYILVLLFGAIMVRRSRTMAQQNRRLRENLQEEVEEKTRYLKLLLTERSQLISELTHDMKSPLTALSNMAEILKLDRGLLGEETQSRVRAIEDKCGALADRLRALQDFAGEAGVPARLRPLSLNALLADFHRNNQPVVELSGPDFRCRLTRLPCVVLADAAKLQRALENLVFNAEDFTPPDGAILLSLTLDGRYACIGVHDTGCGIPQDQLDKVFNRYYTTRGEQEGQGLGLAITRSIVLEHHGEITVESPPGAGTTFTIRLPLAGSAAEPSIDA